MKNYIGQMFDLTGDGYLNPVPAIYDNGQHIRNVSQITSISVHHDASDRPHDYDSVARYYQEAREHYNRLGPGLQYHYKIDNTGAIFRIRPHELWTYTVGSQENVSCIAICLDGNFEYQEPTREQFEALYQLLENLCEQHPEFPATWPNVRSHNDYSATACCGANLRNRIFAINNKADAQAELLNVGVYDWPEFQPAATPEPAPVPVPPQTPKVTVEQINPAVYVSQVATHLDDVQTGEHTKEFGPGVEFQMVDRLKVGDNSWLRTAYSQSKDILNGVPEKDLVLKNQGQPMPPTEPTPPPVPTTPPTPENTDDVEQRLSLLERIVKYITDFLGGLYKGFNAPKE